MHYCYLGQESSSNRFLVLRFTSHGRKRHTFGNWVCHPQVEVASKLLHNSLPVCEARATKREKMLNLWWMSATSPSSPFSSLFLCDFYRGLTGWFFQQKRHRLGAWVADRLCSELFSYMLFCMHMVMQEWTDSLTCPSPCACPRLAKTGLLLKETFVFLFLQLSKEQLWAFYSLEMCTYTPWSHSLEFLASVICGFFLRT